MTRPSFRQGSARSLVLAAVIVAGAGVGTVMSSTELDLSSILRHEPATILRADADEASNQVASNRASAGVIQIEPPVRDLQLVVDGAVVTSDSLGTVPLPPGSQTGPISVAVLGQAVTPAIADVAFVGWSDGVNDPQRVVDSGRPVPLVEIEVRHRVVVDAPGRDATEPLLFTSDAGAVRLVPGEPAWVTARRPGDAEPVTYTLTDRSGRKDDREFVATPEALWIV